MTQLFPPLFLLLLLGLSACAARTETPPFTPVAKSDHDSMTADIMELVEAPDERLEIEQCEKAGNSDRREQCYRYSPTLQSITANEPPQKKTTKIVRKSQTAASGKKIKKTRKITVKGRCQPQCLIYARCRSAFMSCRLGDTNPLSWWPCAKAQGLGSRIPSPGNVMLLDRQADSRMRVGHAVYVEEVCKLKNGQFLLRVSHANYNQRCSLDLDAKVLYDFQTQTASFLSGAWKKWAKNLKTLGFVTG